MYLEHFNLEEMPFSLTPKLKAFFKTPNHFELVLALQQALEMGEGILKVTGEVGTGKTMVCRLLAKRLSSKHAVAYIPHPCSSDLDLLRLLISDFGFTKCAAMGQFELLKTLEDFVFEQHRQNKRVIILLDEVQTFDEKALEMVRLLSNLETDKHKLVQVILFGQPELDAMLKETKWRHLKQRIIHHFSLKPLSKNLTIQYISFRLFHAGAEYQQIFTSAASELVARLSKGTPRLINNLCHQAMMIAYAEGSKNVTADNVLKAYGECHISHFSLNTQFLIKALLVFSFFLIIFAFSLRFI